MAALIKQGKRVLIPVGENQRYDLVIDEGDSFVRVQCKSCYLIRQGTVLEFKACSCHEHRGKGTRDYRGEADVFGVYSPELDKVYLVPVADCGKARAYLRLVETKNKQAAGVRMASQYELR